MVREMDERRLLDEAISRDPDLYDVVLRHGMTRDDLLNGLRDLCRHGMGGGDLWTVVAHAARLTGRSWRPPVADTADVR